MMKPRVVADVVAAVDAADGVVVADVAVVDDGGVVVPCSLQHADVAVAVCAVNAVVWKIEDEARVGVELPDHYVGAIWAMQLAHVFQSDLVLCDDYYDYFDYMEIDLLACCALPLREKHCVGHPAVDADGAFDDDEVRHAYQKTRKKSLNWEPLVRFSPYYCA
jgi:hypothetical protein